MYYMDHLIKLLDMNMNECKDISDKLFHLLTFNILKPILEYQPLI